MVKLMYRFVLCVWMLAAILFTSANAVETERSRTVQAAIEGKPDARTLRVAAALQETKRASRVSAAINADSPRESKVGKALCGCHDTGKCKCPDGGCDCCKNGVEDATKAAERAKAAKLPLVVYYGGMKGSCVNGAFCGRKAEWPVGVTDHERPIVVYAPHADGYRVVSQLPATASKAEIAGKVSEATKAIAELSQPVQAAPQYVLPFCPNGRCQPK